MTKHIFKRLIEEKNILEKPAREFEAKINQKMECWKKILKIERYLKQLFQFLRQSSIDSCLISTENIKLSLRVRDGGYHTSSIYIEKENLMVSEENISRWEICLLSEETIEELEAIFENKINATVRIISYEVSEIYEKTNELLPDLPKKNKRSS